MSNLYTPPDVWTAVDAWNANCAPCAAAALLGRPVMEVRPAFPWFPVRPWTNPTQLGAALRALGQEWVWTSYEQTMGRGLEATQFARMPARGLVVVQVDGPWVDLANRRAAYRYTHTVATRRAPGVPPGTDAGLWVYDVNAGTDEAPGGWLSAGAWALAVMPLLVGDHKRATGWFVRGVYEVSAGR